jgi:hypothetical protein
MRPKKHETLGSGDLFRARLDQIIIWRPETARKHAVKVPESRRADVVSAACEHVSWLGERLSVLPCPSIRTPP